MSFARTSEPPKQSEAKEVDDAQALKPAFTRTSAPDAAFKKKSLNLFSRLSQISSSDTPEEKCRRFVAAQAAWAAKLVDTLVKQEGINRMPEAVLNACEGLAFINSNKGGLVVTAARGYGFVIKKLSQDQYGNSSWSAPLFFNVSQLGFGLAAGYQHTQSVLALVSFGAVEAFKQPTTSMGTDLLLFSTDGALTGMAGGALGHSNQMGMTGVQSKSSFCYSIVDGAYLEISLHGTVIKPDHSTNHGLYQDQHTPDEVLEGKTGKPLPELGVLYRTINMHGRKALGTA